MLPKSPSYFGRVCGYRYLLVFGLLVSAACVCVWTARWAAHAATTQTVMMTAESGMVSGNIASPSATITVSNTNDSGAGSLRQAIADSANGDTINFSVTGAITLTSGELLVNKNVAISGPGANILAVDGNGATRVFHIGPGTTVTIAGLTIRNARKFGSTDLSGSGGGGIYNDHAMLTVTNSTLSGNDSGFGGGICNNGQSGSATLTVSNTTFSRNRGGGEGGAIYNDGQSGSATVTVTNSTLSGNHAGLGPGIANLGASGSATVTLTNSTLNGDFRDNGEGEEIFNHTATVTIGNTIINKGGFFGFNIRNIAGTVTSNGYNLSSDGGVTNINGGTGALNATGDQTNTDPQLGPLAYYGGSVPTHIPLTGSPAIDKGNNLSASTTDQRGPGFARTVDGPTGNATGGDGTDIGAFERQPNEIAPTLIVTTTADSNTNSTCDPASPCSLRDAITAANASAPDDVIYFAVIGTITLNTNGALPNLNGNMMILGPGANALTVKRDPAAATLFRIFTINSGMTATISGLTISGGSVSGSFPANRGGGLYNFHANLTLNNCTVSGNSAVVGGGIENDGTQFPPVATLTVNNSTISGNSANPPGAGFAGIANEAGGGSATLTINNTTISGNSAGTGGGIENYHGGGSGNATLIIKNSTISGNSAFGGGEIANYNSAATVDLTSTILNTGASGENIFNAGGTVTSHGYNLSSDAGVTNTNGGTGALNATGDQTNTNPMLGPLQDNGGPTFTHALLPNSPAIDKGKNVSGLTTDQRGPGFARTFDKLIANAPSGDGTDIGAFEVQNVAPTISGTTISRVQGGPSSNSQIATVSDDADPPTALTVTVNSSNPSNGVTVSNIAVDGSGNVTANVSASCSASNATFTLRVTDTGALFAEATLTVNVTANTAPTLSYNNASVANGGSININPATATDNGSITGYSVQSVVPALTTAPTVNSGGVVSITDAQPGGVHTITIRATDNCGMVTDASFTLTIAKAATATAVSSSANPSATGQNVTFTATVTSVAGTPTGTVQFKDGGANLGLAVTLNSSGVATLSTSSLSAGVHAITADYNGDVSFLISSGTLSGGQQVGSIIKFSASSFNTTENSGFTVITVERTGDLSQAVTVDYATPDDSSALTVLPCSTPNGVAFPRCDFETALGTLRWVAGDSTAKTFTVLINQDNFVEGHETFTLTLSNPTGGAGFTTPGATSLTATLTIADDATEPATNPIDDTDTFVRQHYRDFLNREPDASGLAFWKDNIDKCNDAARRPAGLNVAQCIELFRVNTSAAFFLSIEFQNGGYFVERMYKAAFGDISPPTVPVPVRFTDFIGDTQALGAGLIVGQGNWQLQLDSNKNAFALSFVQRSVFLNRYPALTSATAFVDSLNGNAGNVLSDSERSALISELSPQPADPSLRAGVLRKVADNALLQQQELNRAFVLMEYFGYLRRNPDAAPEQNLNFDGYNFWLNKLNQFNGDFAKAEMVKAFISSSEYRQRFGP